MALLLQLTLLVASLFSIGLFIWTEQPHESAKLDFTEHKLVRLRCLLDSPLLPGSGAVVRQHSDSTNSHKPVKSKSDAFHDAMDAFQASHPGDFDVWGEQRCSALVRLSPRAKTTIWTSLTTVFDVEIVHENVQSLVDAEKVAPIGISSDVPAFVTDYHDLDQIYEFLDETVKAHPGLVSHVTVGKSHQGREIRGVTFKRHGASAARAALVSDKSVEEQDQKEPEKPKFAFVMNGGIHAREWISVAVMNYLIHRLTLTNSNETTFATLLDDYEITIIPVLNPDGYVYSHTKDRMWRKNRQPNKSIIPMPSCTGTDLNRNWGYKWNTGGSSPSPCVDNYQGPAALSAPESTAMYKYLEQHANASVPVRVYIDTHAFSQLWMYPYGWTCDNIKGIDKVDEGAKRGAEALKKVHGKSFGVGGICKTIYPASGSSVDSAFSFGIPFAYGIELRDQGANGFLLPRSQIVPSGEELEAGLIAMGKFAASVLKSSS